MTDIESYRQSVFAAIEAAGPEVFPEFYEPVSEPEEDVTYNTEMGRVERPEPSAPARGPENVTYGPVEGVSENFHRFLAQKRATSNGGRDHPSIRQVEPGYR